MHPSTPLVAAILALGCSAPACAWDGEPVLRLPGEASVSAGIGASSLMWRSWAQDLSERLARLPHPPLAQVGSTRLPTDTPLLLERSRNALALHWRPWSVGAWRFGAAVGLHRSLPGSTTPGFAAMPMASYAHSQVRMSLGLMPPRNDRSSALVLGLTVPLH